MTRMFPDGFEDGIETNFAGRTFASARNDSFTANSPKGITSQSVPNVNNDMSTMIGQLLTHELLKTNKAQLTKDKMSGGFNCCNPKNDSTLANLIKINKYCTPIYVQRTDECFGNSTNCLNYVKSLKTLDNCELNSTALPINFHTSFLDCELIYNDISLAHLDTNKGVFNVDNTTVMRSILVEYDDRSEQLPGLFLYLTIFARFHNIIFSQLQSFKKTLSTQALSFEARKITCAANQKIFLDFLVNILRECAFDNV